MPTSVYLALALILAATWIVVRVLRKPAAPPVPSTRPAGAAVYAPPKAAPAPAPAPAPMRVMQMRCHGFLAIEDADGAREEALPASPLGAGEFPMGIYVAPDHTVFAVGKQYTGKPGPDDGVVWRRAPGGAWSTALRLPGRVIGAVAGRSSREVVAAATGGIACFDGEIWREVPLPYAKMWEAWVDGDELVVQAFDGSLAFTVAGGATSPCPPRRRPDRDRYTMTVDGTRYRVFDRSEEIGERTLSADEEREIRGELAQVQRALAASEAKTRS